MTKHRARILAIDDTPANLVTLGAALKADFDLQIAKSALKGLALAAQSPPDLILLDVMMPNMDGYEACRRLKADPRLRDIPVIFVTALTEIDAENTGLILGAADYITKPVNVAIARQRIHNLLEREQLRRQVEAHRDHLEELVEARTATILEGRANLEAALAAMSDAVFIVDSGGLLIHCNDAFATFHKFKSREECARTLATYADFLGLHSMDGESVPHEQWPVPRALRGESAVNAEFTLHRCDTDDQWMGSYTFAPVRDQDGVIIGAVVAARDITARKRSEAELNGLRAEMDRITRFHVANETIAAIAHELNQPLNAVVSYSDAARRMLDAGIQKPDELTHALEANAQQAKRAGQVVHQLLAFISQGMMETEVLDLNETVHNVLARMKDYGLGAFKSRLEFEPNLAAVRVNRLQVEKVLINLIQNAIEAMHGAGIKPKQVTLATRTSDDENMAQVTVGDSGPGIDAQTLQRLFDPFFTTKTKGLGMGLSISRSIVEAQEGRLWAESAPGAGARFHFTLPFAL